MSWISTKLKLVQSQQDQMSKQSLLKSNKNDQTSNTNFLNFNEESYWMILERRMLRW